MFEIVPMALWKVVLIVLGILGTVVFVLMILAGIAVGLEKAEQNLRKSLKTDRTTDQWRQKNPPKGN